MSLSGRNRIFLAAIGRALSFVVVIFPLLLHTACKFDRGFGVKPLEESDLRGEGQASALVISGPRRVSPGSCSEAFTVAVTDTSGTASILDSEATILLSVGGSGAFFDDEGCTTAVSSVAVNAGASSRNFFFRGMSSETLELNATTSGLRSAAYTLVVSDAVASLVWSGSGTVVSGECTELAITVVDDKGMGTQADKAVEVTLASSGAGNFYLDAGCSLPSSAVILPPGSTAQSVFFKGNPVENVAISASAFGLAKADLTLTVKAGAPSATRSTAVASTGNVIADGVSSSSLVVTLRDVNDNPVSGEVVALGAISGTSPIIAPASGTTNGNGIVTFSVKSGTPGGVTLQARVVTDGNLALSQTVPLNFVVASLSMGESAFGFGQVSQGGTASHVVMARNNGGASATNISISGLSGVFSQQNDCGGSLAAGATCRITVSFSPVTVGVVPAQTLSLSYSSISAASGTNTTVTDLLSGTGISNALLALSESSFDFGTRDVGGSYEHDFTMTNNGQTGATNLGFTGLSGNYSVSHNCGNNLASGGSCGVKVTVHPTESGVSQQTLQISYNKLGAVSGTNAMVTNAFTINAAGGAPFTLYFADGNAGIRKLGGPDTIFSLAGTGISGFSGDGGPATAAQIGSMGVVVDKAGNTYVLEPGNHRVRKVGPDGRIGTIIGTGTAGFGGDGGSALDANLSFPFAMALDSRNQLYIADLQNGRIRRVDSQGIITTVAGSPMGFAPDGEGVPALEALLPEPTALAVDSRDNVYISDSLMRRILKMSAGPNSVMTTLATDVASYGVAVDTAGNVYFSEHEKHRVFKLTPAGEISVVAGTGNPGFSGDNGPAVAAELNFPWSLAIDAQGNLYVGERSNKRVRKITPGGTISTVAGNASGVFESLVAATATDIGTPRGLALDSLGQLYIASEEGRILKISPSVSRVWQSGAQASVAVGLAMDRAGNIYFSDHGTHQVKKMSPQGAVIPVAGDGTPGFSGDNGPATSARLNRPTGLAVDGADNLYISDSDNHRVRKVSPQGVISTILGTGAAGCCDDGGLATSAKLSSPMGLAIDGTGNLFIADSNNHRIRKVTPQGMISTVAGLGTAGFSGEGGSALAAKIHTPTGIAVDHGGALYFADSGNFRIRKVGSSGLITTVAGTGVSGFSGDGGLAVSAKLSTAAGIAVDGAGNIYFADAGNQRIRLMTSDNRIHTLAGIGVPVAIDGIASDSGLAQPWGIVVKGVAGTGP